MTGPIRDTTGERMQDAFVESPTRANKTAVEVTGQLDVTIDTTGLAKELKQDSQITELQSINSELDSHSTKLDNLLTELQQKTEPANAQNIRPLTFIGDKVDSTGSVVALDLNTLAALENTSVSVTSSALPTGASTSAKQDSLLAELQLKADLTETQPVSVSSLPLPLNASTSALQTSGNSILSNILSAISGILNIRNLVFASDKVDVSGSTITANLGTIAGSATSANQVLEKTTLDSIDSKLTTLNGKDFSTQTTLASRNAESTQLLIKAKTDNIDVALSTRATELTQAAQSVLIGAVTETSPASDTASSGLNGRLQRISQRLTSILSTLPSSLGIKSETQSLSVADAEDPTYSAAINNLPLVLLATDVFSLTGSATKTIKILKLEVTGSTTSGSPVGCGLQIIKRSTANMLGVISAVTATPNNSTYAAATATARAYTANATLGTLVGITRAIRIAFNQTGITGGAIVYNFKNQPIYLNGVNEVLAVNLNATTIAGGLLSAYIEWKEL